MRGKAINKAGITKYFDCLQEIIAWTGPQTFLSEYQWSFGKRCTVYIR